MAVKTETQQAVLMMHRMREQLVKFRTMQINGLRGMLAEFGEVMGKGRSGWTRQFRMRSRVSQSVCRRY